jgi:adenylate kinase family enzyme
VEHTKHPLEGRKRILVVGCAGAGKSTFSKRLGELLGLPVVHLDSFFWGPGWKETRPDEWEAKVRELTRREAWVMDGNYGGTMDVRLAAADAAVFLDMPRNLCLWRVIGRRFRFAGKPRPDMAPGCPEKIEWQFLKYIWNYPKTRKPGVLAKLESLPDGKETFVLRSSGETEEFLREIEARTGAW